MNLDKNLNNCVDYFKKKCYNGVSLNDTYNYALFKKHEED